MIYKIAVNIPREFIDDLMDAVDAAVTPIYPKYRRAFSYWPTEGTWIPTDGANPYLGTVGSIEKAEEMHIEFAVDEADLRTVVTVIRNIHPYEEPCIDIIPMLPWKEFVLSDDM